MAWPHLVVGRISTDCCIVAVVAMASDAAFTASMVHCTACHVLQILCLADDTFSSSCYSIGYLSHADFIVSRDRHSTLLVAANKPSKPLSCLLALSISLFTQTPHCGAARQNVLGPTVVASAPHAPSASVITPAFRACASVTRTRHRPHVLRMPRTQQLLLVIRAIMTVNVSDGSLHHSVPNRYQSSLFYLVNGYLQIRTYIQLFIIPRPTPAPPIVSTLRIPIKKHQPHSLSSHLRFLLAIVKPTPNFVILALPLLVEIRILPVDVCIVIVIIIIIRIVV
jgi:hypothetical protein